MERKNGMKWTRDSRDYVFGRLFEEFGPIKNWGDAGYPSGKKKEYESLLLTMKTVLKKRFEIEVTIGAIRNQIGWGIQKNQTSVNSSGYFYNYILNRASALHVGLIGSGDLPKFAAFERTTKKKGT